MAKVHQIKITIDGVSDHAQSPPGHPNLWKALEKNTGKLKCFRSIALHLEDRLDAINSIPPTIEDFQDWLCFPGVHRVEFVSHVKRVTLQVRRFGKNPDPMATLVNDLLNVKGFKNRYNVWMARQSEFEIDEDSSTNVSYGEREKILESSLKHVLDLGSKNGIFQPSLEEARVVLPGSDWSWSTLRMPPVETVAELRDQIHYFVSQGKWSLLKRSYRVTQKAQWTETVVSESVRNPSKQFAKVFGKIEGTLDVMTEPMQKGAPVDLLVSLTRNPDSYSNLDKFRMRCENFASLLDRPLGQVIFRKSTLGIPYFDTWSSIENHQRMNFENINESQTLCTFGSWDKRNPIFQRRAEYFFSKCGEVPSFMIGPTEIVSGNQDWIAYLCEMLSKFNSGWSIRFDHMSHLASLNASRTSTENIAFLWVNSANVQNVKKIAEKAGIPFAAILNFDLGDKVVFVDAQNLLKGEMPIREFFSSNPERDQVLDLDWKVLETKAPLFGFDRVALFPDEFILRVSFREQSEIDWIHELKKHASGEGLRTLLIRSNGTQALPAYRWTDGTNMWGVATARNECWANVDPSKSIFYALDAALRNLISLGAPLQNMLADVCVSVPEIESKNQLATMVLSSEGCAKYFAEWGVQLASVKEIAVQDAGMSPEIFIRLNSRMTDATVAPFPGFRMAGEHLFMIGPKPIYMDSGSRVLQHLSRIESNHMSIYDHQKQIVFYEKVLDLLRKGWILSLRPILDGGLALALSEMCLWSRMGAQVRPGISPIELFSCAPGRFLVGVLPSELSKFEASFSSEQRFSVGVSGGEKIMGLTLERLEKARSGKRVI